MEESEPLQQKAYKRSRVYYNIEAALEYLISLLVTGTFLARLTDYLGFSDSLTGIISSIISLGSLFQLLSLLYRRHQVKRFVVALSVVNQLLFMLLYIIPLNSEQGVASGWKTALFAVIIISAYVIYNAVFPKKINWFMSLVDPRQRGVFTANKEIISLITGILFTLGMGQLVDYFKDKGELRTAFILCAVTIFVLMVMHTLTMVLSIERPAEETEKRTGALRSMLSLLKDKEIVRVAILLVLWRLATYSTTSFLGSYQNKELGFSQLLSVIITSVGSVARMIISRFWGRYADKRSFARMVRICYIFAAVSFLAVSFATPKTGVVCFLIYNVLIGVANGGTGSAELNLVFERASAEKRADALAFCHAFAGAAGFLTTLAVSPLVSYIQKIGGLTVFGVTLYAQQVTSVIATVLCVITILYLTFVVMRKRNNK